MPLTPECTAFREDTNNRKHCTAERAEMLAEIERLRTETATFAYEAGQALVEHGRARRREALEEAARVVEVDFMHREGGRWADGRPCTCDDCRTLRGVVAAIRALAEKDGGR